MRIILAIVSVLLLAACAAPAAEPAVDEKADGWIKLFDGKTLNGWKASENPAQWKVEDGAIVASGPRSHLFYMGSDERKPAEFKNFHFKADVLTTPGSNSGIYFHTRFQANDWPQIGHEAQVNNSHTDPVRTGSLYSVVKIFDPPAKDDTWFTEEVIVEGNRITTKVNGKTLYEFDEPEGIHGQRKLSSGTFALQAHDPKSLTRYKNVMVKRLPETKR